MPDEPLSTPAPGTAVSKTAAAVTLPIRPRAAGIPLLRWLYDEIRLAIVEGRLEPGARLPSTRAVARQYRVARGTVVAAYDHLIAEGYIEGSVGSGSFVHRMTPQGRSGSGRARQRPAAASPLLSVRGRRLAAHPFALPWGSHDPRQLTFLPDHAALEAFPLATWSRISARCLRRAPADGLLEHGSALGLPALREAIAAHVGSTRGVRCSAEQVVISAGTQQSLDFIVRLVLDEGDRAWVEDPGYPAVIRLLRACGAQVIGVPVDEEGIDCAAGSRRARLARLAYVTPSCQYPLGSTMSLQRRLDLLRWAVEAGAVIFEDDYDSELAFADRPLVALQSLDRTGCVIYSNSFSKMLFPSLRLGFLVVPERLVEAVAAARSVLERFPSVLEQAVLAEFIGAGHMEQHMRRMRELYTARLQALAQAARSEIADVMQLAPVRAGLQIVGWLAPGIDDVEACRAALAQRIYATPLSRLTIDRTLPPGLVLYPAASDEAAIRRGVAQLGAILRGLLRAARGAAASQANAAAPALGRASHPLPR
jgi:GntR family transcriptional regulator/MocR family aminotransferase